MHLLTLENISLFLPGDRSRKLVLRDIDWQIGHGDHCAVFGPNGAGKSTLLRLAAGLLWPARGKILWKTSTGPDDSPLSGRQLAELVSPAMQEGIRTQAWGIRAREFLLRALPAGQTENIEEIMALAKELDFSAWLDSGLAALSQGQLRIILLARALLRKPELLLLDECLDGLDEDHRNRFLAHLEKISPAVTMVFAGHRGDALPAWVRRKIYLHKGAILPEASAPEERSRTACPNPQNAVRPGKALVSLRNVDIYMDRELCVSKVNWIIREGENWRLGGANGSGKSTLLRLLAGDEFAAAGGSCRRFFGEEDTLANTRRHVHLISDLGQALYGYPLTALDLVCSGFDNSTGVYRDFVEDEISMARDAIRRSFPDEWERICGTSIRQLSSGQLRRLHLARALMTVPTLLLLDEACSGLDRPSREAFIDLVDDLAINGFNGHKPQIIYVSHYSEDAPACLNREAWMEAGRLFIRR